MEEKPGVEPGNVQISVHRMSRLFFERGRADMRRAFNSNISGGTPSDSWAWLVGVMAHR